MLIHFLVQFLKTTVIFVNKLCRVTQSVPIQVLYLHYLLKYKLRQDTSPGHREIRESQTYVLFLDGDVVFKPNAVFLLADLLKRDESVGGCCGRVHPNGSGTRFIAS